MPAVCEVGGEGGEAHTHATFNLEKIIQGHISCWSWYAPVCLFLALILCVLVTETFKKLRSVFSCNFAHHHAVPMPSARNEDYRRKRRQLNLPRRRMLRNEQMQHPIPEVLPFNSNEKSIYHSTNFKIRKNECRTILDTFPCPDLVHICPLMKSETLSPIIDCKRDHSFTGTPCTLKSMTAYASLASSAAQAEPQNWEATDEKLEESSDEELPSYLDLTESKDSTSLLTRDLSESLLNLSLPQCDMSVSDLQKSFEFFGQEEVSVGQFIILAVAKHLYNKLCGTVI